MATTDAVRQESTKYGLVVVLAGLVLLVALRVWTSPLVRTMTGRQQNGIVEFLLIPVLLLLVAAGVALFLWEPDENR